MASCFLHYSLSSPNALVSVHLKNYSFLLAFIDWLRGAKLFILVILDGLCGDVCGWHPWHVGLVPRSEGDRPGA